MNAARGSGALMVASGRWGWVWMEVLLELLLQERRSVCVALVAIAGRRYTYTACTTHCGTSTALQTRHVDSMFCLQAPPFVKGWCPFVVAEAASQRWRPAHAVPSRTRPFSCSWDSPAFPSGRRQRRRSTATPAMAPPTTALGAGLQPVREQLKPHQHTRVCRPCTRCE